MPCTSFPGRGAGRRQRGMTGYVGRGRSQASTFCAHLCTTSLLFCISTSEHGGCQPVTNQPLVSVAAQIKSATRKVEQSKHTTAARKCRLKRSQSVLACLLGQMHGTLRWMHRMQSRMQLNALHSCGGGSSVTAGREHVSGPSSGVQSATPHASTTSPTISDPFCGAAPHC